MKEKFRQWRRNHLESVGFIEGGCTFCDWYPNVPFSCGARWTHYRWAYIGGCKYIDTFYEYVIDEKCNISIEEK